MTIGEAKNQVHRRPASQEILNSTCAELIHGILNDRDHRVETSKEIVNSLMTKFDLKFSKTGYKDYDEYLKFIKSNHGEISDELVEMIQEENVNFTMRIPSRNRLSITKNGFLNVHSSHVKAGSSDVTLRNEVEAALLNVSNSDYRKMNDKIKPKYGFIAPKEEYSLDGYNMRSYGDDIFTFKKNKVKDRLTWTRGDSLRNMGTANEFERKRMGISQMFIPWKNRALMIPFLMESFENGSFKPEKMVSPFLDNFEFKIKDSSYFEIQIWGPVDLSDVSEFTFTTRPPEGEFLNDLIKHGVRIYDATVDQLWKKPVRKEWKAKQ